MGEKRGSALALSLFPFSQAPECFFRSYCLFLLLSQILLYRRRLMLGPPLDLVRTKYIRKHDHLFLIPASLMVPPRVRLPLGGLVEAVKSADLEAPCPTPLRGHMALEVSPPPGLSLGGHRRAPLEGLLRATF